MFLVDTHCADGSTMFDTENTRAYVSYGTVRGRESCVEVDSAHAITMFYRNQGCRNGRTEYEEFQSHRPSTWQPRCLVLLIEPDNRAALRDELVEIGRSLIDPINVMVQFTTTLSADPDFQVSSVNCAIGRELQMLHEHDLVGQTDTDLVHTLEEELTKARVQEQLFRDVVDGLSAYRPPNPPPPPSPLPAGINAPPAAPAAVSFAERQAQLTERVDDLTRQLAKARSAVKICIPSATTTCGRTTIQAPDPWLPRGDQKCAGYYTREGAEGMFCGYWQSPANPMALDSAEASELLTEGGAPYCFSESGIALKCSVRAERTYRAGVYELEEWARLDRPYCTSDLFRELVMDNVSSTEAECRTGLRERIRSCNRELCPECVSPCIFPVARTIGSVAKCANPITHFGFLWTYMISDAGQLARSMHGARRKDGFKPIPERLSQHLQHIAHYNPAGFVQRDSVSCRREHRTSPSAHFTPGFDETGMPVSRQGYMVACRVHTDCLPCGRHPITDQHYRCQKRHILYDTVVTNTGFNPRAIGTERFYDDQEFAFLNETGGSASAFDIDLEAAAMTGQTGICVDIDSSYNQGCSLTKFAAVKDAFVGCADAVYSKFLCGLSVEVLHGDLSTVRFGGNLWYPRVLLDGSADHDGDGQADPALQCWDPLDCSQKCRHLERTARHGAGAPQPCAMCKSPRAHTHCPIRLFCTRRSSDWREIVFSHKGDQYCPSNLLQTGYDFFYAYFEDIWTVIHLIATCFGNHGIGGCVCQFVVTLQPEWRKQTTNEKVLCRNGDPWEIMLDQVNSQIVNWAEWGINELIDVANRAIHSTFGFFGAPEETFDHICFPTTIEPLKCKKDVDGELNAEQARKQFAECEDENFKGGLDLVCYYHRVRAH